MESNCKVGHGAEHDGIKTDEYLLCQPDCVLAHKDDIVCRNIAGETFLVPIRGDLADMQKIFTLDAVAAFIWEAMDGKRTLFDICDLIVEKFDVTRESAAADIEAFCSELLENRLVFEL